MEHFGSVRAMVRWPLVPSRVLVWLIQLAEKMLRKNPGRITFLAPLCTFFLTVLVGTGHVVYTLMPIICDIALKKGIRPERPCGVASIAS